MSNLREQERQAQNMSLEMLCLKIKEEGDKYAEFQQVAERLEQLRKPLRCQIALEHIKYDPHISIGKAEIFARADESYIKHIEAMVEMKKEALKQKNKWEAYKNLFEARRTKEATDRTKIQQGLYHSV